MKKIIIIILVFIIAVSGTLFFNYRKDLSSMIEKSKIIKSKLENPNLEEIDFAKITDFEWDKMMSISPYSDVKDRFKEYNQKYVSEIYDLTAFSNIDVLVFTLKKDIVCFVDYENQYGSFLIDNGFYVTKDSAVFVKKEGKYFLKSNQVN